MTPEKEKPRHQGHQGERTSDTRDDTDTASSRKPEIDLGSWLALGKQARTRRFKASHRRGGAQ
jgi:hypothetical protein